MPANGEERKIELIGTSGTPSPTVKSKKYRQIGTSAPRSTRCASQGRRPMHSRIGKIKLANRDVGDAVPYRISEKISVDRDVGDAASCTAESDR